MLIPPVLTKESGNVPISWPAGEEMDMTCSSAQEYWASGYEVIIEAMGERQRREKWGSNNVYGKAAGWRKSRTNPSHDVAKLIT
jgi:hypothetical protein